MTTPSTSKFNILTPRFGTPGNAALFVGSDLRSDYFYFPMSQCAVVVSEQGHKLLTQYEEDAHGTAQYDFARCLFDLTTPGYTP